MEQIKAEALRLVDMVLQNPASDTGRWVAGVIAVLVLAWTFLKIGDRLDLPNVGIFSSFMYTALGSAIVIFSMAAAHVYLNQYQVMLGDIAFFSIVALVSSLVLVVPIVNGAINGNYMGTMTAWGIGVATATVAIFFVLNVFEIINEGGQMLQRGAEHNETTKAVIKKL